MIKKIRTKFSGLFVYEGKIYNDKRGNLREAFNKKDIPKNLCLSVVSKSKKGVLRGLHLQINKPQDKIISVLKGKILDVVVDLRRNSNTFGQNFKIILSEKKARYLLIPKGFAHGFLGLDKENIVLYSCSNLRHAKGERSIKWNDQELNIKWGIKKPIISKRDKLALSLKEFLEKN
jgi:dTDP-4-dehydrorhamnose 3,5-epimerase